MNEISEKQKALTQEEISKVKISLEI